jgi:queuine tRNA-ribosyltransferase
MAFTVEKTDPASRARTGSLALGHGTVRTPCFMPVGTNGSVKAIGNGALEDMGLTLILGNTYHLYLRPGTEVIGAAGGLHRFMGWHHNILTDSGGYQVFSLSPFRRILDDGVVFRSHLDGSTHRLSPEDIVSIQGVLGSDVLMPLDVCTPPGIPRAEAAEAVRLTREWLARSKSAWLGMEGPLRGQLFGIMQGNFVPELRAESARGMVELDLPGYAIGGLSVGEEFSVFRDFTHSSAELLPDSKPRYLMGIGTPQYILEAVDAGIDLFDCVFPTRTARNALVFTSRGTLNLRNEAHRKDFSPIDDACGCATCRIHSRAYLRHLFKAREIQAAVLATCHNLAFIQTLVSGIRRAISLGSFASFKKDFLESYSGGSAAPGGLQ